MAMTQAQMAARIAQLEAQIAAKAPAVTFKAVSGTSKASGLPYKGVNLTGPGRPAYLSSGFASALLAALEADPKGLTDALRNALK